MRHEAYKFRPMGDPRSLQGCSLLLPTVPCFVETMRDQLLIFNDSSSVFDYSTLTYVRTDHAWDLSVVDHPYGVRLRYYGQRGGESNLYVSHCRDRIRVN